MSLSMMDSEDARIFWLLPDSASANVLSPHLDFSYRKCSKKLLRQNF